MIPQQRLAEDTLASLRDFSDLAFLTVAEVASVLRVSKMTVYRMVHAGELPAKRIGRSFRVQAKAVREYLEGSTVETAAQPAAEPATSRDIG
jgi:excisionase family DNA binding protein